MKRSRITPALRLGSILAALVVACSPAPTVGTIAVSMTGLPSGVVGSAVVTGPNGYSQAITATTTLSVPPGAYSLTVNPAQGPGAIVPVVYDGGAAPTSVTVVAGGSVTTTVTYAARPGSGTLWIPQWQGTSQVVGYGAAQLATSGTPAPDLGFAGPTDRSEAVAFDADGNMWVTDIDGFLYGYSAASLADAGTLTPAVTIDATAYGRPVGLAFDASGNLWTAIFNNGQLLGYSPTQLAAGGTPTPVVISASGGSLDHPCGLAFDTWGNLWVANQWNGTLVQFTPAQLAATGDPMPAVWLSNNAGSLGAPYALAFDAGGNLWVANVSPHDNVVRFDAGQLTSTGSPVPAATIDSGSLGSNPAGLAFDATGGLWVGFHTGPTTEVRRFANPGSLVGDVTPTASVVIGSIGYADGILMAFNPPPANLPINTP